MTKLCKLCHPTAFSLAFLWNEEMRNDATTVHLMAGEEDTRIRGLCQKYERTIELAISLSVNASVLCLDGLEEIAKGNHGAS
jgi:hypothetical protein